MFSFYYIITILFTFSLYIFILRLWMQCLRVNFYNPFTQFIVKITQPILAPIKQILPIIKNIDTAVLLVIYFLGILKIIFIIHFLLNGPL
ncbi:MAG: YggT family protein, partial [Candidatus Schmidhempelia sp.]|nr:YggT family protein [Candidatus Schmidhempelia sp.]